MFLCLLAGGLGRCWPRGGCTAAVIPMGMGAVPSPPGASYITALHQLITSKSSTATQAVAVVIFVIIEFALVIVPYAFHRPNPAELIVLPSAPSLSRSQAATADGASVTLAG